MNRFYNSIVVVVALSSISHADSVTCHYFYNPIKDVAPIESTTPNYSKNQVLDILKDVLSNHFNVQKITPDMTIQAFENYLELIDPHQIFISKEDLAKVAYPHRAFFENLHLNWFNEHTPPVYKALYGKARDRMDNYINRFVHNDAFRMRILDRANEIFEMNRWESNDHRPERTSDIEIKVVEHLARVLVQFVKSTEKDTIRKLSHADLAKLVRALRIEIQTHNENVSESSMTAVIAKSFLNTFDAHTDMYLPNEARLSLDSSKASRTSLGISIGIHKDGIAILEVFPGGVAEKSGLLKNDVVLAIEPVSNSRQWYSTKHLTMREYTDFLTGEPESNLKIRILRDAKEYIVELTRKQTTSGQRSVLPAEIRNTPAGSIMSVKLNSFSSGSAIALKKEIAKNKTADLKGLILDLRGNLGGSVREMENIVQMFAGRADAMIVRGRSMISVERSMTNGATVWDGPLVILVDFSSASSSEALAAALQANKRAIIVGGPLTFGKGSMQVYKETENAMYKYTSALFFSPTGSPIQWHGVRVDIPLVATQPSELFSERIQPNSIKPKPLGGPVSSISYLIPNLETINKTLLEKSRSRGLADQTDGKRPNEIYSLNTDEAYRIVEDWIQLENTKKK